MSRVSWDLIKNSKRFYVRTYRKIGTAILISCAINLCLGGAIYYTYFSRPLNDFYATNGVTPPDMLTAMDEANESSVPMIADDDEGDVQIKVIPQ